ncbi:VWA domain-containing protein [Amycolatopsis sp. NBC_00355]|uniref:vWA domain-containing protein n=1 Tax=Amycolatopsis sp. NBC_00355 TaxID=2975957 RepID=UPI002E2608BA
MSPEFTKSKCLPTYFVFDTSSSMAENEKLLNDTLEELYNTLAESPLVGEFAHVSIVSFNDEAEVVVEMTDLGDLQSLPQFSCNGRTSYGKVFTLLREQIDRDIPALNATGKAVLRPAVFIMTDGLPTDSGWQNAFAALADDDWPRHPHVITYGFGKAVQEVLGKIATKAAFIAEAHTTDKTAITAVLSNMLRTLVASAKADQLQIPTEVAGFTSVPLEYMG